MRYPNSIAAARLAVAAVVVAGTGTAMPTAAALSGADVTVDGSLLAGTTRAGGVFDVAVAAPPGVTVKFRLDGTYLGQDATAPYSWPIRTTAGTHTVNVRWDDAGGRQEVDATFTVTSAPAPAPTTSPAPTPAGGSSSTVTVSTAAQLTAALKEARPGQTIALADGTYTGRFVAAASGTPTQPITLAGSPRAVLTTGTSTSGYALHITGDHWNVSGLSVTRAAKGIVLDGSSFTVIDGVDVGNTGAEGVHLRTDSAHVTVRDSRVHDTGLAQPAYGEGIYIGSAKSNWASIMGSSSTPDRSDDAQIIGNTISRTPAEGIDVKEGTTGGILRGNTFSEAGYSGQNSADSWVDVKGNGYLVTDNRGAGTLRDAFQVHVALPGWGRDNVFRGNTVTGGVPGYEVSVQSGATGTVVACAPSGAARGLTDITCTG